MVEALQESWLEGMNFMVRCAFDSAEIVHGQMRRAVAAALEQGEKMHREVEKSTAEWMDSVARNGAEMRRVFEGTVDALKPGEKAKARAGQD